jgi:hypothetical protein
MSGRWGEMIAFKGPKVTAATILADSEPPPGGVVDQTICPDDRTLHLSTDGDPIKEVKRFTTMERFRADSGGGYYVQPRPKPEPYVINFESGNSVVRTLRRGHDGRCFRIHEASNVSFLIGCISPRPLGEFTSAFPNNPASLSMNELIDFAGFDKANFFVHDW